MHAGYGMAVSAVYMTYTIQNLKGYLVKLWKMTFVIRMYVLELQIYQVSYLQHEFHTSILNLTLSCIQAGHHRPEIHSKRHLYLHSN